MAEELFLPDSAKQCGDLWRRRAGNVASRGDILLHFAISIDIIEARFWQGLGTMLNT
jgi:hypothetical protein